MNKKEIISYLKKANLVKLDYDTFLCTRQTEVFTTNKKEILINLGKDLFFALNFSKKKDFFGYSAICSNGYELQMKLESCFNILKKYLNCELSEQQIFEYIK